MLDEVLPVLASELTHRKVPVDAQLDLDLQAGQILLVEMNETVSGVLGWRVAENGRARQRGRADAAGHLLWRVRGRRGGRRSGRGQRGYGGHDGGHPQR